jgi:hypothetical protein
LLAATTEIRCKFVNVAIAVSVFARGFEIPSLWIGTFPPTPEPQSTTSSLM